MPHTRESALRARAGGAAAHLQSKMRSIAGSFLSSGMLIGDEEAASHWALSRLGVSMCPGILANGRTAVPLVGSHCAAELVRLIVTLMPPALLLPHAGPASSEHHAIASSAGWRGGKAGRQVVLQAAD